uniref:BTB domain-containing protein n=1 Tax=Anopheles dirus TaxID=7168 RepID=A0A182N8Z4_9DIPT
MDTIPSRDLSYGTHDTICSRQESMVDNQFCSDVTFIVGTSKQRIYAHKLYLVMASEYFYVMFFSSFLEAERREVYLEDVEPDVFLAVLRYIYTQQVDITNDNLRDIFDCSQRYMLTELMQLLSRFLQEQVEPESALAIFSKNRYFAFTAVDESCLRLIRNNPLYYFNHEDFTTIDRESLSMILGSKQINCTEDQLCSALEIWEAANRDNDACELRTLVKERSYDCLKLLVFGQSMSDGFMGPPEDLKMTLMSETPVSVYGLGVYISSKADVVSVELKIYEEELEISSDVFECPNKSVTTVHVADLFFEEVVLVPRKTYRISIKMSPPCKQLLLRDPRVFHDTIKLAIPCYSNERKPVGIAHLYCKETPDMKKD